MVTTRFIKKIVFRQKMNCIKRALELIVAAQIGLSGCAASETKQPQGISHDQYSFCGFIDGEFVTFEEKYGDRWNTLSASRMEDGCVFSVEYNDINDDLKPDIINIKIVVNTNYREASNILQAEQKEFDAYLKRIQEAKGLSTH